MRKFLLPAFPLAKAQCHLAKRESVRHLKGVRHLSTLKANGNRNLAARQTPVLQSLISNH